MTNQVNEKTTRPISSSERTCRAHRQLTQNFNHGKYDKLRICHLFAAGFIAGQAEKVYNGACAACSYAYPLVAYKGMHALCAEIADIYGLRLTEVIGNNNVEAWLHAKPDGSPAVYLSYPENSPEWHRLRAEICGIKGYDPKFHETAMAIDNIFHDESKLSDTDAPLREPLSHNA